MKIKRILLVVVSIVGLLVIAFGVVGFILTSNTSAKADEALSNPPEALADEPSTIDFNARLDTYYADTKDSASVFKDYSSDDTGCNHDQTIDWAAED